MKQDDSAPLNRFFSSAQQKIELIKAPHLVPYEEALSFMESRVSLISKGKQPECLWFLEHTPVYTSGARGSKEDLIDIGNVPLIQTRRGGRVTYHGPGQRVIYMMINLGERLRDLKAFLHAVEALIVKALLQLDIKAFASRERIGIWTIHQGQEIKVAAIGLQVRQWVTFHGVSINVCPQMDAFKRIVPCGVRGFSVGALSMINPAITLEAFDEAILGTLDEADLKIF